MIGVSENHTRDFNSLNWSIWEDAGVVTNERNVTSAKQLPAAWHGHQDTFTYAWLAPFVKSGYVEVALDASVEQNKMEL